MARIKLNLFSPDDLDLMKRDLTRIQSARALRLGESSVFNQISDLSCLPCRSNGATTSLFSQSGQPETIARYSFLSRRCCMSIPNFRAAARCFRNENETTRLAVEPVQIETWPPLAISMRAAHAIGSKVSALRSASWDEREEMPVYLLRHNRRFHR